MKRDAWIRLIVLGWLVAGFGNATAQDADVSIAFVGDIMVDSLPGKAIEQGHDPFAPFASLLKNTDIRVGNLECVVATSGSAEQGKPWTFRAHPRALPLLKRHFDALALSNNHSGDFGPKAFGEMLGLLEEQGISYFGGGRDLAQAHRPLIVERKGLRIALLGYNEFFPRAFEADQDKPGVAWSDDEQVRYDIRAARERWGADLVIPFMHWGWENERSASARQRRLARLMIDAGADAVVGGHPHVTQNIEQYKGKPIIYSLGNFVFDGFDTAANNTGWLLRMDLDRAGVKRWKILVAHINKQGLPHPAAEAKSLCQERGEASFRTCRTGS